MKKSTASKTKKVAPVKQEQKITNFFKKIELTKSEKENTAQDLSENNKIITTKVACQADSDLNTDDAGLDLNKCIIGDVTIQTTRHNSGSIGKKVIIDQFAQNESTGTLLPEEIRNNENIYVEVYKRAIKNETRRNLNEIDVYNESNNSILSTNIFTSGISTKNNYEIVSKNSLFPGILNENVVNDELTVDDILELTSDENCNKKRKYENLSLNTSQKKAKHSLLECSVLSKKSPLKLINFSSELNKNVSVLNSSTNTKTSKFNDKICQNSCELEHENVHSFPLDSFQEKDEEYVTSSNSSNRKSSLSTIENKENYENIDFSLFEDIWDSELDKLEISEDCLNLEIWQYCVVLEVTKSIQSLILKVESIENKQLAVCLLEGFWQYTNLEVGNKINIIASKIVGEIPYTVNNDKGLLTVEPDIHISPTSIVGAQFCRRRGVLAYHYRTEMDNKYLVVGILVHQLMESALKANIQSSTYIENKLQHLLSSTDFIRKSYYYNLSIEQIKQDVQEYIPRIVSFLAKYMPKSNNKPRHEKIRPDTWQGCIDSVLEVEDTVCSPRLGITGSVDATIKVRGSGAIMPLELKSGRISMSIEHRGQVILYTMLMNDLGLNVPSGLLIYLRDGAAFEIFAKHSEQRDILMLRNEILYYIHKLPKIQEDGIHLNDTTVKLPVDPNIKFSIRELPEPINHHSACEKCAHLHLCTAYLSEEKHELSNNNPLKNLHEETLKQLKLSHSKYLNHWTSLIMLESTYRGQEKKIQEIWRVPPLERERRGRSLCFLRLHRYVSTNDSNHILSFIRSTSEEMTTLLGKGLKMNFLLTGLEVGDWVTVNTDNRWKITSGGITYISNEEIHVSLDKNLYERRAMQVFHLDTYETPHQAVSAHFYNLSALMDLSDRAKRLRELIIDLKPSVISNKLPKSIIPLANDLLRNLNKKQQRAVLTACTVNDYLLIKGMPGTGKTATIVALIRLLVQLKKSVIITSYTHSAVDNVCLRLLEHHIEFLRLGSSSRVHAKLKHRTEDVLSSQCKTVEDMKNVYENAQVVAVTCLSAKHPMFQHRKMDVCVVDESTQVMQCLLIKPLILAKTFVLIGDPNQLPPVVRNPEALRGGMAVSLFERLDSPSSTITLDLQYRMNRVITDLANSLTYNGELRCANETVAQAVLNILNLEILKMSYKQEEWILRILDSRIQHSVVVLDTGPVWKHSEFVDAGEEAVVLGELVVMPKNVIEDEERTFCNKYEVAIVISILQALKLGGISAESIGIIAPYKLQVSYIKKKLCKLDKDEDKFYKNIEVNTVDQYQGRDKDVIILSCTRSRDTSKIKNKSGFEILDDKRRLTVAITRAKYKLIIIGDIQTMCDYTPLKTLFDSVSSDHILKLENGYLGFSWTKIL